MKRKQKSDLTKVAIKNENITSLGGIYYIEDVFSKLGFEKIIKSALGKRGCNGRAFCRGSIFSSLFFSCLCGGECLKDINALKGQFVQRPDTLLPGADTVGRGLKELAEKNIVHKNETSGKSYSFNTAEKLNILLLRMIRGMGLIKAGSHVDLDFDHQFVPAHKFNAKYSYKQNFGYSLGLVSIGGIIVRGEMQRRLHPPGQPHRRKDVQACGKAKCLERQGRQGTDGHVRSDIHIPLYPYQQLVVCRDYASNSGTNLYTYHFIHLRYILQNTLCSPLHSSRNKALKVGVLLLFSA